MLHRIELPFPPDALAGVFSLQMELLELACNVKRLQRGELDAHFQNSALVDWIMNSYQRTVGILNQFANTCPADTKQLIMGELRHDYNYWQNRNDESFTFSYTRNDNHREIIGRWLVGYFEQFGSGIDAVVTGVDFINKGKWSEAFRVQNPGQRTCPICDGSLKGGVTIEHFLPKEKYPILSVHIANLVPACEDCNGPKGNKDPLDFGVLPELFLPYERNALTFCDVDVTKNPDGNFVFLINPKENFPDSLTYLNAYSQLFEIPDRWNRRATTQSIVDLAISKIEEQIDADHDEGVVIMTVDDFLVRLEVLCGRMERQWGKQPNFVPATGWLRWAKNHMIDALWKRYFPQISMQVIKGNSVRSIP